MTDSLTTQSRAYNPFCAVIAESEIDGGSLAQDFDVILAGGIGAGCLMPFSATGVDIWQIVTLTGRVYTISTEVRDLFQDLLNVAQAPTYPNLQGRCHARIRGFPFVDAAGHPSILVTEVHEPPFFYETGHLGQSMLQAIANARPTTHFEACTAMAKQLMANHNCTVALAMGRDARFVTVARNNEILSKTEFRTLKDLETIVETTIG